MMTEYSMSSHKMVPSSREHTILYVKYTVHRIGENGDRAVLYCAYKCVISSITYCTFISVSHPEIQLHFSQNSATMTQFLHWSAWWVLMKDFPLSGLLKSYELPMRQQWRILGNSMAPGRATRGENRKSISALNDIIQHFAHKHAG